MKTPAELIAELQSILIGVEDDDLSVREYGRLFAVLTAHPDIEGVMDGMNRLSWLIVDHGNNLSAAHDRMREIVRRLANP